MQTALCKTQFTPPFQSVILILQLLIIFALLKMQKMYILLAEHYRPMGV